MSQPDSRPADAATVSAQEQLAVFWNAWFYKHEIEKARAFAADHSEDECRVELDRLWATRDSRLEAWRYTQ